MARLILDIRSFWQVGTGAGQMGTFDSRAARDPLDLPVIPGRQVKGLCRDSMWQAEQLGLCEKGKTVELFGARADPGKALLAAPAPAKLRFSDARLPEAERNALAGRVAAISELFHMRRATAISDAGTAVAHSLRFDELVIPLKLEAEVEWCAKEVEPEVGAWRISLKAVLPLLTAVGSWRTRGMGRVHVTLECL